MIEWGNYSMDTWTQAMSDQLNLVYWDEMDWDEEPYITLSDIFDG